VGERIQVAMPREFDLVVNFERHLRLPFLTSSLSCQWAAMGCFDRRSNPVEPPEVAVSPGAVHVRGEVVGVLRVRCTALGWLHGIVLPFSPADSLEDIETVATASWAVGAEPHTAQLSLELPGCLEDLLALCPDGSSMASRARGELIPQDKILPTVYYSDCTGEVLEVRRERA
jgi:hypothetical protein